MLLVYESLILENTDAIAVMIFLADSRMFSHAIHVMEHIYICTGIYWYIIS